MQRGLIQDDGFHPPTLVELLRRRAAERPGHVAFTFLLDGEEEEASLTYGELDGQARAIGSSLARAVAAGERVLLLYPPGLEYIAAFFGCLYAGAIAVPAYPPRLNRNLLRLEAVVADARAAAALTTDSILSKMGPLLAQNSSLAALRWLTHEGLSGAADGGWRPPSVGGESPAFLQYTSGSTSSPKGVVLTHRNLLHNEAAMARAFGQDEHSVVVGWLPLYHDMGLIGNVIQPLYVGARSILMSPVAFLQRPWRWLRAVSRYRATTSGGPNFAFDLCVRKVTPEQRGRLDLSSWSVAFNGSEPVRAETLERFAATFAPHGFRREAFRPCYGLAEATLLVSVNREAGPPVVRNVAARALEAGRAVEAAGDGADARPVVGCGEVLPDQEVVIVDPERSERLPPGRVGEVWISGPSVAEGYWRRPEETEHTFRARLSATEGPTYLRTGDLGFTEGGQLFITGRLKDLIIIRGRNHYPQDIELTAEKCHPALRPGCGAAFSVEAGGEERLVVVQEADTRQSPELSLALEAIRAGVTDEHEVQVHAVVLLRPGSIPKTSSGKIQRHACRAAFLEDGLRAVAVWRAGTDGVGAAAAPTPPAHSAAAFADFLRALLAARLGVEPHTIDVNESVARYGLDSLAAIDLAHGVETHLGATLPLASFLQGATLAELASEAFRRATAPPPQGRAAGGAPAEGVARHPLSRGQQALWFLYQMAPASTAYNLVSAARVASDVDAPAFRRALRALAARHPQLRASFSADEGEPVQLIHERMEIAFREEDASAWSEESVRARLSAEAHRPFDLESGPLLRVHLFRRSPGESCLLLTAHHIVIDFWSLEVLTHELGILYAAEREGRPATLPTSSWQFTDYVRWQEQMLAGAEGERHWEYWRRQLAGELPVADLPFDRPRPPVQTYRGASVHFSLSPETTRRLKSLGREHGATLYMTLVAAFDVLLHRYTGQTDIAVGSPMNGRAGAGTAGLVGYLVNPVVLRADLSGDPTFVDVLKRVRRVVLEAFEHQDYPFALLVERLQPVRDPSRAPLFQILLTLQKAHLHDGGDGLASLALGRAGAEMNLGGLRLRPLELEQQVSQFDLRLMLAEAEGGLAASLQYSTDLFDAATVKRLAGHFQTLLEGIAADPARRLSDLPLVSGAERRQLLTGWNGTRADYPRAACLHELIEAQVERTPEAAAVSSEGRPLTYRQLDARANQVAHHLRRLGVGPEARVGVLLERSAELVVALLGVLKAGAAYVPLDPAYPRRRVEFMLKDARVEVLISSRELIEGVGRECGRVVCLDEDEGPVGDESEGRVAGGAAPGNLAYVIYTSGSTGLPKGAMNTHAAIVNRLDWMQKAYGLTADDCVLQKTPFSFDVSVWEFFWPLMTGARLHVARPGGHRDPAYLKETIIRQSVTTVHFVPSMLQIFLDEPGVEECRSLRRVICSGEELKFELQERYHARLGAALHNLYGPTEAAVDVTHWACERGDARRLVPIGRPIANTQIHLLDGRGQLVPVGVPGELYIGGAGVGRGYVDNPGLTAERFVPDPFGGEAGARLYRTGDRARRLPAGELLYEGRLDDQLKVRGMRVEPGEIEAALRTHPAVGECAVVAREAEAGGRRLVAYVVARAGAGPATGGEWREYLKGRLPEYLIPSAFVALERLPLTPSGKLDRRALPAPEPARAEMTSGYTEPRTPAEEALARIWTEVLGVERVGVHDNFFELGGDSILSLQIVARANHAGLSLTPEQMFRHQTIAELAVVAGTGAGVGGEQIEVSGAVPLTPIQHWFFEEPPVEPHRFSQSVLLEARQALSAALLRAAVEALIRHHDALRLRFERTREGWRQTSRGRERHNVYSWVDLSALGSGAQDGALRAATEEVQGSLRLTEGPLVRVALFDLGAGRPSRLLIVIHQLAVDAASWRILLEDLERAYAQLSRGEAVDLGIKTTSFKQWAERLQGYAEAGEFRRELEYWLERGPRLSVDRAEGSNGADTARTVCVELSREETQALLHDVPAAYGTQVGEALLAALALAERRRGGAKALVVDVEGPLRDGAFADVELSRTVGWFSAVFPLTLDLGAAPSPGEALERIKEQVRAVPRRGAGYGVLKYLCAEERARELRASPAAEVSFSYLGQLDQVLPESAFFYPSAGAYGPHQAGRRARRYLIEIEASVTGGRLGVRWTYSENLHARSTVDGLTGEFNEALRELIRHCQAKGERHFTPSDFPLAKLDRHKLSKLSALLDKTDPGR